MSPYWGEREGHLFLVAGSRFEIKNPALFQSEAVVSLLSLCLPEFIICISASSFIILISCEPETMSYSMKPHSLMSWSVILADLT